MSAVTQPSGEVTLVFSDIEGSTRLLEELGTEAYREALAEHRRIVREACARYAGYEVDYEGDAFFYAFSSAADAVSAVSEAMAGLEQGSIKIRVGIHTGAPGLDPPKYVGMDVHFAARVMSSAHGGQVVCSRATAELVEQELIELGEHRLKDIPEAVPLFQLGEGSFPPLKTISNTNLPRPASSFLGREVELADVVSRIEQGARLLTLTGPGGTGKTRLAIEAATSLVGEYTAGVFWVGLASLRDPALVTETIAQTLGAKDGLASHIGERELLLLLDNLEQVIEAAPELSALLSACPNLTLLVTSRELLRIQGEVEYPVPPLAQPEAVALFCARSQLEPSEEIAELCTRLDSLPLAVELAAARTKALSPAQILERLAGRLDLLKGGRDADPRQQTLRATIEWSYDLLSPEEQELFARLSIFSGGCTLEAAEEVADADLDTLQSLVEKSLLRFTNERYWMLETIREYAAGRLDGSGELQALESRHADFVLGLTLQLEAVSGSDAERRKLHAEQDNFRKAFTWAEEHRRTDAQLDLISRTWLFWANRGHLREGMRWVESALARSEGERSERTAKVLVGAALFALRLGEYSKVRSYARESLEIGRTLDSARSSVWPLIVLGLAATQFEDYDEAAELLCEAITLGRQVDDQAAVGIALNNLGDIALRKGDYVRAIPLLEEALEISRRLRTADEVAVETYNLALALHRTGRQDEAVLAARESLMMASEIANVLSVADALVLLGALAGRRGDPELGARLLGSAQALRLAIGETIAGVEAEVLETTEHELAAFLGDGEYAKAFAHGRAMSLDQAVELALASID